MKDVNCFLNSIIGSVLALNAFISLSDEILMPNPVDIVMDSTIFSVVSNTFAILALYFSALNLL